MPRYFVKIDDCPEREVTAEEFVRAERDAGFHPKPGCGPFATAGFGVTRYDGPDGRRSINGRIEFNA